MRTILGIVAILALAIFAVAYLYFSNLNANSRNNDRALAAIPASASVVFQFQNDKSLYDILNDYPVFDDIAGLKKKDQMTWLKSLLLNNEEVYAATQGQQIFISFHPTKQNNISSLWLIALKQEFTEDQLRSVFGMPEENEVSILQNGRFPLIGIKNKNLADTFYVYSDKGLARGSFSKPLLLQSLDQNTEKISQEFIKEINSSALKNNDALTNFYINHHQPGFLRPFFRAEPSGNFSLFESSNTFTSFNMNYKSDALVFNGVTRLSGAGDDYIKLFLNQNPVKNTIKGIMPYNISNAISYGVSDYSRFREALHSLLDRRNELKPITEGFQALTQETGINPDRDIQKFWSNEFSTIQLSTYESLSIIRITNGSQLSFFLEQLSSAYSPEIRKLNYENLFYYYFGDPVRNFNKPFYTIIDNLIIISNSPVTLQHYLGDYKANRILPYYSAFNRFDQLVADQGNISFLLHFSNSNSLLSSLLNRSYSNILNSDQYGIRNFYGLSYQLISNKDHFFANFYIGYKEGTLKPDSLINDQGDRQ